MSMPQRSARLACAAVGTMLLVAGGCAYERGYSEAPGGEYEYVSVQPVAPPAPVEVVAASPGPGYVWIDGYYDWYGPAPYRHRWVPGHWERPAHSHAVWERGEWQRDQRGYRWRRGHWR
jgi:hypothetical protein